MSQLIRYLALLCLATSPVLAQAPPPAQNVIIITLDGFRWQEVFGGFDPLLNDDKSGGVASPKALAKAFARDSAEESRAAILPFVWNTIAKQGQLFGDRGLNNVAYVTNPYRFSYPGYSEMMCGFVDPKIDSNKDFPNPNATVFEWLNTRPGFENKVAAFGAWDRLKAILNPSRSNIPAVAGWSPITPFHGASLSERENTLNDLLAHTTRVWPDEPPDSIITEAAIEYFTRHKPRVFWVMLGETDEWAHGRRYDLYLESAKRSDAFIERLWTLAQSMPEYTGKTALVLATDHGRGLTGADWVTHGSKVEGAQGWWAAMMGPGIAQAGVRGQGEVVQAQLAATIAAILGQDYPAAQPKAASPLPGIGGK